jgi:lipopolysaccharide biosynthesis glycosyltransferase
MNNQKEKLNILFCCDTNYAMPLTVCVTSIFENNKDENIHIYVLYSSLSDVQKEKLHSLTQSYNQTINLIPVAEHYFSTAPVLRWSKETYYRLLINELLPNDLDRILYLDCDVIVNKSVHTFYGQDLTGYFMGALRTEMSYADFGKRLNLKPEGYYYQCGVILFNLKECRNYLSYETSIKVIEDIGNNMLAVDQDVLNVMFYGKIKDIEMIFNNDEITNFCRNNLNRLFNKINKTMLLDTVIFHYAAGKPWNNMFSGSCEEVWYTYLKLSPYAELYTKKYGTLKYKVLRLSIIKVVFYKYTSIAPYINKFFSTLFPQKIYGKLKSFYRRKIK